MSDPRPMRSEYMHWAKTRQTARYTLATSGVLPLERTDLDLTWDDVPLHGRDVYGFSPLIATIAAHYGVEPGRVVTAAGTSGANHLAMAALVVPGDEVAIEHPVYEPVETLARHLGAIVRRFPRRPENDFGIDPADVSRAVGPKTRLIVLSNLHNPAPVAVDAVTMGAIGEIASRVGARVLVDEVYLDAAFEAAPPSAATLGAPFVVTSSLTKVYGLGGLRAGWIVASPEVAARMWDLKNLFGVDDPRPAEGMALAAWRQLAKLGTRARAILDANRAAWHAFLASHPGDLEAPAAPIGTTSFPRVLRGDGDALEAILRERYETTVVPGRFFGAPDRVRIGLGGDPANFRGGLDRFDAALSR